MQLTCAISGESLAYRFTGDTPEQWLASFRQHRWDLEDLKWVILMVLFNSPGCENAYQQMEELLFEVNEGMLH